MSDKLLYTVSEAAELLSVGRTTMYSAVQSGRLESIKIGASRRITREALIAYVEQLREEQAA